MKFSMLPVPQAPDNLPSNGHFVSLLGRQEDFECVMLASMGLNDRAIAAQTGLTIGQITYRLVLAREALTKARLTRKDYRAGFSPLAKKVFQLAGGMAAKQIMPPLRELEDRNGAG